MRVKYYYDHNQFKKATKCQICGKRFWAHGWEMTPLATYAKGHSLCIECAKWQHLSENRPENMEVIDGVAYDVQPYIKKEYGMHLGGNGELKCLVHADGTSRVSNDVWVIGKIPERFLELFPQTAWWTKPKYAKRLQRGVLHCKGRMCYDRYHCFRYDYTQEFENGPYNIPPKEHIVGSEHCREFINIQDITNYPYFNIEDI